MIELLTAMPKYDAYKDSGEEWLGEVPEHWEIAPLKHSVLLVSEKISSRESTLKYYGMENVESWSGRFIETETEVEGLASKFNERDILFGKLRPYLAKVTLTQNEGICSTEFLVYRVTKHSPDFFRYLLVSTTFINLIDASTYGSKMPRASADFIGIQRTLIPTLPEQVSIAEFLDRKTAQIDQAVSIKEKQIALLKERKQILIQNAVTRGLNPDAPMRDSGVEWIGEIPAHWKTLFNRRLFREKSRAITDKAELPLSLSQVDGVIPSMDMKERSLSPAHRNNFKLCYPGDLIVNRFKGHLGVLFESKYRGIVTFHYGVFEPCLPMNTKYFEHLYHTDIYRTVYAGASNGMTLGLQNLSNQNFYMVKTIYPPLEEQKEIILYIETESAKIDQAISIQQQQIDKLKEYKATLINSAVTGKIKVPELSGEKDAA